MALRRRDLGIGLVVGALLAACGGADDSADLPSGSEPASAKDFAGPGITYDLARVVVDGVALEVRDVPGDDVLRVSGTGLRLVTGCHDVIAEYELDREGDLTLIDQRGPQVGCAEADLEQAGRLTQVVSSGARWTLDGTELVARKGDVEVTFAPLGAR